MNLSWYEKYILTCTCIQGEEFHSAQTLSCLHAFEGLPNPLSAHSPSPQPSELTWPVTTHVHVHTCSSLATGLVWAYPMIAAAETLPVWVVEGVLSFTHTLTGRCTGVTTVRSGCAQVSHAHVQPHYATVCHTPPPLRHCVPHSTPTTPLCATLHEGSSTCHTLSQVRKERPTLHML